MTTYLSAQDTKARLTDTSTHLVDVRSPAEFQGEHIQGAINIPLDQLNPTELETQLNCSAEDIILVCLSGKRANEAAKKWNTGTPPAVMIGGMKALPSNLLPLNQGKTHMSLERQVRVAAGSLVLAGVVLGHLVHPGLYGISAFVGAGLVFAGLTDTCGMALLLAKMPWNQRPAQPTACTVT